MRCIYICMMIYSDISVIFIYIYTIHRLFIGFLLTLQIGFPPKNNPEVNQSRLYLCSTIRAGAQWKSHLPTNQKVKSSTWENKNPALVGKYPIVLPGLQKHPNGGWPWDGISEPSAVSSTLGWTWLSFCSMYFWIISQVVQLLSFHRRWVSKIFSFAPRKTNGRPLKINGWKYFLLK